MKLILLGTGGFLPTDAAQTACYFLPEVGVMLDAGHGLYRLPAYLNTRELDIYLSHAHADHTSGLDYVFASYLKADLKASSQELSAENVDGFVRRANESLPQTRIHADEATLAIVRAKYFQFPYDWRSLQARETLPGGGVLTHFELENGVIGYRLDWPGHSLAYVTDTIARPDAAYIGNLAGVDLLLHDCYTPDHLSGLADIIGHSHLSAVMQVSAAAGVKRLVLIHHSPIETLEYSAGLERARQIFAPVEIGFDGMEIDF
jgi:ribonuclease BN (tRNA processing enzyme)